MYDSITSSSNIYTNKNMDDIRSHNSFLSPHVTHRDNYDEYFSLDHDYITFYKSSNNEEEKMANVVQYLGTQER